MRHTPALRVLLARMAAKGHWLLAILLVVLAFRFTVTAVSLRPPTPVARTIAAAPVPKPQDPLPVLALAPTPTVPTPTELMADPNPRSTKASKAASPHRLILLSASSDEARSEVYVNGELVGQTPFLGDVSCRTGEPVKVQVVPKQGPMVEFTPSCEGATIRVRGDREGP